MSRTKSEKQDRAFSEKERRLAKDYWAQRNREYREAHPDKVLQYRIKSAINLLEGNGYMVTKIDEQAQ